jgi:hypothetical protein
MLLQGLPCCASIRVHVALCHGTQHHNTWHNYDRVPTPQ